MKDDLLELLKKSDDYISGERMSEIFGVSRSYIWKCIKGLREDGYEIQSAQNRGYRLVASPDVLSYREVKDYLKTRSLGRKIEYFSSLDSTNTYAKKIAGQASEGLVIVADEQTQGRGRLGRDWQSKRGEGLYFSIILRPDLPPDKVAKLTLLGVAALVRALDEMGISSLIKWPNDLIIEDRKVAGILTEMAGELNYIDYIVMGFGINVNNPRESFAGELEDKATSLRLEAGTRINRQELLGRILNNLEVLYLEFVEEGTFESSLKVAREKSILIDREVRLLRAGQEELVVVKDISDEGDLIIIDGNGRERLVYSGEVSIRARRGYI